MVSTVEQALTKQALSAELWDLNNDLTISYRCRKDVNKLRTRLGYCKNNNILDTCRLIITCCPAAFLLQELLRVD